MIQKNAKKYLFYIKRVNFATLTLIEVSAVSIANATNMIRVNYDLFNIFAN